MSKINRFAWYKGDTNISQCVFCIHKKRGNFCNAFPIEIPYDILNNEIIHHKPIESQNNSIVFEAINDKDAL